MKMKKKILSVILSILIMPASVWALGCECVMAECHSVPAGSESPGLSCHQEKPTTPNYPGPVTECCGKCRIEKAAEIQKGIGISGLAKSGAGDVFKKWVLPISVSGLRGSGWKGFEPFVPSGFFIDRVLNHTFAFRAPPAGSTVNILSPSFF